MPIALYQTAQGVGWDPQPNTYTWMDDRVIIAKNGSLSEVGRRIVANLQQYTPKIYNTQ